LSMKKFGTPTGAGPGIDSEKVGLFAAGTPLPVGRLDFALRFDLDLDLDLDFGFDFDFDFDLCVFVPDFFSVLELGAC
jgi:hypothetical protein